MEIRYEEQDGLYRIMREDRQIGVVREQTDGSFGYSVFGTPHMGRERSMEDVEKAIQRAVG